MDSFTPEQIQAINQIIDSHAQEVVFFWIKSLVIGGGGFVGILWTGFLKWGLDLKKRISAAQIANEVLKSQNQELRADIDKLEKKVFK